MKKPIVLCILDGFGLYKDYPGNAINNASTPFFDYLYDNYPWTKINAAENWVGLPKGQMGNSEVGHLNIGAGRLIDQPLVQISKAVENKTLHKKEVIKNAIAFAQKHNSNIHVFGLLSDGGVHSHIDHYKAILDIFTQADLPTYAHVFLDGRDTSPKLGDKFLQAIKDYNILTISGRYYAMDRDKKFDRLQQTLDVMLNREGDSFNDAVSYVQNCHQKDVGDEFVKPAFNQNIDVVIKDNDVIFMVNFRPDRANQITGAFAGVDYEFKPQVPINLHYCSMTKLADYTKTNVVFPLVVPPNTLGHWLSNHGYHQLRIAESEKYAHITFFFDGGEDVEIKNSTRIVLPSPKVATYDLKPEMSLFEVTNQLCVEIKKGKYDVIILNYANADMVGHTGNYGATVKAIEAIDQGLKQIYDTCQSHNGVMFITADHGNAEEMLDENNKPKTAHTKNQIPFIVTDQNVQLVDHNKASLSGVAASIITYLGQDIPQEMTGKNIITKIKK